MQASSGPQDVMCHKQNFHHWSNFRIALFVSPGRSMLSSTNSHCIHNSASCTQGYGSGEDRKIKWTKKISLDCWWVLFPTLPLPNSGKWERKRHSSRAKLSVHKGQGFLEVYSCSDCWERKIKNMGGQPHLLLFSIRKVNLDIANDFNLWISFELFSRFLLFTLKTSFEWERSIMASR